MQDPENAFRAEGDEGLRGVHLEAGEVGSDHHHGQREPRQQPAAPRREQEQERPQRPDDQAVRQSVGGRDAREARRDQGGRPAPRERHDRGTQQENHGEVVDRGARPEEVLVVLQLEEQEGQQHRQPGRACHRARRRREQHPQREQAPHADPAHHAEVDGPRGPVEHREQEPARHHPVLVVDREQILQKRARALALVQLHREPQRGVELVPIDDVQPPRRRAFEDVSHGQQRQAQQAEEHQPGPPRRR
ncbi:MAG: hypothetical protein ACO3G4_03195 [Opitutaceae bacterium]